MGGFITPSTAISGTVLAPGIPVSGSPLSGLFAFGNGYGFALSSVAFHTLNALGITFGPKPAQSFTLAGVAGSPFSTGAATLPRGVAVSPNGLRVAVCDYNSNTVNIFLRNPVTGALAQVAGSPFAVTFNPVMVAFSPDNVHLLIAHFIGAGGQVSVFTCDTINGALTPVVGSPFNAGLATQYVTLSPDGLHVFAVNTNSNAVSVFSRNAGTGFLTPVVGSPFAVGVTPYACAVSPDGAHLYVTNTGGNSLSAFSINVGTGALTPVSGSPFASVAPYGVKVHPSGAFVLVAQTNNTIQVLSRDTLTGMLNPTGAFASGGTPLDVSISPDGLNVVTANNGTNNVSAYTFNPATGVLTAVAGSPFACGTTPFNATFTPDGQQVIVPNYATNNVTVFATAAVSYPHLIEAFFDPMGGANGTYNVNGTLLVRGVPVTPVPSTVGVPGKFLRSDANGNLLWDGVNTYLPVAMVANAGAFSVDDTAEYIVEVTGALTAQGALTATVTVPADPLKVVFDNLTTGGFPLVLAGTYTLPAGRSYWYWNGATLEMLSAGGFRTANVTPLPAAGSVIALNHLCGSVPKNVQIEMVCLTAENGYAINDVVNANAQYNGAATAPLNYWLSATQMGFKLIALYTLTMGSKTTGAIVTPTAANWAYRFMVQP